MGYPVRRELLLLGVALGILACQPKPGVAVKSAPLSSSSASSPSPAFPPALSPQKYRDALSPEAKESYEASLDELLCPCGKAETFRVCVEEERCPEALQAASVLARLLSLGLSREQAEARMAESFGREPWQFSLENSPWIGAKDAPVVLVEFADFQCPHCARLAPVLKEVLAARPQEVKLVYKYFPIPSHPFAYTTAEAAAFAAAHGKFWELHALFFEKQEEISRESILAWARSLGLDEAALADALDQGLYQEVIRADEEEGERAGVGHTPTLFINGRVFCEKPTSEAILRWIDEELAAKASRR